MSEFLVFCKSFFSKAFFTLVINLLISIGLDMKSYAPFFRQLTAVSISACPEIIRKTLSGFIERLWVRSSFPDNLGILMSEIIRSKSFFSINL